MYKKIVRSKYKNIRNTERCLRKRYDQATLLKVLREKLVWNGFGHVLDKK